ncbi:MAG: hypothetical protein II943_02370 [Victivallales bacterium]|nr:hypothetical protein [Victivallales bacterium]
MGKFGKNLAPVVAVFAIVALVMSLLVSKQGKLFRQRAEVLAEGLASAANVLDSGSGNAQKAAYKKSENGEPESGPLGWPEFAKDSGAYEQSAKSVASLASQVVDQRDEIIAKVVAVGEKLEAPDGKRPDEEVLKNLNSYGEGLEDFVAFVDARVKRDKDLFGQINNLAASLSVPDKFTGEITDNGKLGDGDQKFLAGVQTRIEGLKKNFRGYQELIRNMSQTLTALPLRHPGGSWHVLRPDDSVFMSNNGVGLSDEDMKRLRENFTKNLQVLQKELEMIPQLEAELAATKNELAEMQEKLTKCEEKLQADEEVIENYYRQGLGMSSVQRNREAKNNYAEIDPDLAGMVLQVDSKYGYIIIDLSKFDVIPGVTFSVHRSSNGGYLGEITVVSVEEFNSIARMVRGDIDDVSIGDKVVVGSRAIQ